jgi:hypothetical protein
LPHRKSEKPKWSYCKLGPYLLTFQNLGIHLIFYLPNLKFVPLTLKQMLLMHPTCIVHVSLLAWDGFAQKKNLRQAISASSEFGREGDEA